MNSKDGIILIDPYVNSHYNRLNIGIKLSPIFESKLCFKMFPSFLGSGCYGTPFFWLGFLAGDDHSTSSMFSGPSFTSATAIAIANFLRFLSYGFRDIGNQVLDIELILVKLLLNLPFYFGLIIIELALTLCSLGVAIIAE